MEKWGKEWDIPLLFHFVLKFGTKEYKHTPKNGIKFLISEHSRSHSPYCISLGGLTYLDTQRSYQDTQNIIFQFQFGYKFSLRIIVRRDIKTLHSL